MNTGRVFLLPLLDDVEKVNCIYGGMINENYVSDESLLCITNGKNFHLPVRQNITLVQPNKVGIRILDDSFLALVRRSGKLEGYISDKIEVKGETIHIGKLSISKKHFVLPLSQGEYVLSEVPAKETVKTVNMLTKDQFPLIDSRNSYIFQVSGWAKLIYSAFDAQEKELYYGDLLTTAAFQIIPNKLEEQVALLSVCDDEGMPYEVNVPGIDIHVAVFNWILHNTAFKIDEIVFFYSQRKELVDRLAFFESGGRNLSEKFYNIEEQKQGSLFEYATKADLVETIFVNQSESDLYDPMLD